MEGAQTKSEADRAFVRQAIREMQWLPSTGPVAWTAEMIAKAAVQAEGTVDVIISRLSPENAGVWVVCAKSAKDHICIAGQSSSDLPWRERADGLYEVWFGAISQTGNPTP